MIKYHDPIPTNASKVTVAKFAEDVAKYLSFEPGEPIETVVSKLGGGILYKNPVGESKPESIVVEPDRSFKIYLPSMTSASRDRFTIAHELGHFFLHFPIVEKTYPQSGMCAYRWVEDENVVLQRCEWEANWFAASFVMPEDRFKAASDETGSIGSVAARFGVSEKAAQVRARSLGLV